MHLLDVWGWEALLLDPSLRVAMTAGALAPGLEATPAQSFNASLQHVGSIQCLLMCLHGFLEGLTVGLLSSSDLGVRLGLLTWLQGKCCAPL